MDSTLLLGFERMEREHWWFIVRRRLVLEAVAAISPDENARILEVGCGTGGLIEDLQRAYPNARISGVEPNSDAACVARRGGCQIDVGVFEDLSAADASVDLLIALDVLEHCADDHRSAVEAYRVVSPGGSLVVTVPALPALWGPHDERNEHHRRYVRSTLREPLEQAGFTVERLTYFNTVLLPMGYAGRLVSRTTRSARGSGMELPAPPVNAMLRGIFGVEVPLLRRANLPIGMSLLAVATKRPC